MSTNKLVPINYRSDRRIKGGKIGYCILCDRLRQLSLSHIIPKWLYQPLMREGGIIHNFESLNLPDFLDQDGSKQYLLCASCESEMSIHENYIRTVMIGTPSNHSKIGIEFRNGLIYGLNYSTILKYMLGTTIRVHYATCAPYHKFALDIKTLNIVKSEYRDCTNNDLKFLCMATKFHYNVLYKIESNAIIHVDLGIIKKYKVPFLTILAYGWEWQLCIDINYRIKHHDSLIKSRICVDKPYELLEGNILEHRSLNR